MDMEDNEFNPEDSSENEESISGDKIFCAIFAKIATKYDEWINSFPFFQSHPKLAKCVIFPVTGVLMLIFFLGVLITAFAKSNSNNSD